MYPRIRAILFLLENKCMFVYIRSVARHKTISDEALLDGLMSAITEHGPAGLTFAGAAAAVTLSPSTLVQRFGSREAMVEAILLRAWDRLDAATSAADATAAPGAAGAVDLLMSLMPAETVEHAMLEGLLLLREDFRNPRLRARGKAWGDCLAVALGQRLNGDVQEGLRLGWQMARVWQGALLWWAFTRHDRPEVAIRTALEDWCQTAVAS
ncbi:TetR/AcrR family transcriptional regulator [Melittangium boletus]|nr:TetR/AcrR family transcriptional regulator [Melittangium boletus]